jgi:hypothetical protein
VSAAFASRNLIYIAAQVSEKQIKETWMDPHSHQGDKPDPEPLKKAGSASGFASKCKIGSGSESASNKNQNLDPYESDKSDPFRNTG